MEESNHIVDMMGSQTRLICIVKNRWIKYNNDYKIDLV